eukprot:gnl/TRDRNA2_/TRDRNA2_151574_c0_seq1.p1 gnl/TRDRNA2_/TRDRNA2_151574_c0~~gnl/TRDRNA2_/TRDRNA2_151574_c0_seq1.p1  ORF type:complete len:238 (+),score=56.83 gnl/TRDRNA2_/TRDRNA2_151574_c0_seq1:352-1065(+)
MPDEEEAKQIRPFQELMHQGGPGSTWVVVGGSADKGIVVRSEKDLSSPELDRLFRGARIEEIERSVDRLHFKKIDGVGPDTGWVSIWYKGRPRVRLLDFANVPVPQVRPTNKAKQGESTQKKADKDVKESISTEEHESCEKRGEEAEERHSSPGTVWVVVGGTDKGVGLRGIVVRKTHELKSEELSMLEKGARVQEIDRRGDRLHYKKLDGRGPWRGWVTVKYNNGMRLLKRVPEID